MKNVKLYSLILFLMVFTLLAQEIKSEQEINTDFKITGVTENFQTPVATLNEIITSNYVSVFQIGESNLSAVKIISDQSIVDINQNGFNNYINIDKSANSLHQTILQNGNNNFIQDQSLYSNSFVLNRFTQQGDNLSLYNFGSNSISDSMSVLQTGNQKSIIIINSK